jgi:hypothetical protein
VAAFADDVQRYLAGQPIQALPARMTDRLYKFVLRNKAVVAAATIAIAVIIGAVGYTIHRETATRDKIAASAAALPVPAVDESTHGSPAAPERSVAVLPFLDMSEKKDQAYFADGLAEELLDLLAQVPDLKVTARSSSFSFRGGNVQVKNVGHELGVAYVLEGGVCCRFQ